MFLDLMHPAMLSLPFFSVLSSAYIRGQYMASLYRLAACGGGSDGLGTKAGCRKMNNET